MRFVFLLNHFGQADGNGNRVVFAAGIDGAAVQKDDFLRDGQPKAGAAGIGDAGFVQTVKFVKE